MNSAGQVSVPEEAFAAPTSCQCSAPCTDSLLCPDCGLPVGWEIPGTPIKPSKGITCQECPDVLIPPRDVHHLRLLDISIPCPLCGALLETSQQKGEWETGFLAGRPESVSEDTILGFWRKALVTISDTLPNNRSHRLVLPPEYHLAGRLMLHWVQRNPQLSEAFMLELFTYWTQPLGVGLPELVALVRSPQSVGEDILGPLYHGSVFLHQLQRYLKSGNVGERFRAQIILRLLCPPLYTGREELQRACRQLTYPQRLLLEDVYSALYWQSDADTTTREYRSLVYFLLEKGVPASEARGCLKSQAKGCFIATACYGASDSAQVKTLREFRDESLARTRMGRAMTACYYATSPCIADWLHDHPRVAICLRKQVLDRIVASIRHYHGERTTHPRLGGDRSDGC